MSGRGVTFLVDDPKWKTARGLRSHLRRAADAALAHCGIEDKNALTILLASDQRLRVLNRSFRGKDKPTNVLSFPAAANRDGYRGDVAVAYGVTVREAKAAGKRMGDHAAHLVVHGVLHLLGYDHE